MTLSEENTTTTTNTNTSDEKEGGNAMSSEVLEKVPISTNAIKELLSSSTNPITSSQSVTSEMAIDTTSLSLPRGVPTCAICSEPCIRSCKSCKKVSYCSKEHQKQHLTQHQPECYPVIVQTSSLGSHLILTRDVRRGEVILRENPLVFAPFPFPQQGENISLCLSCHKVMVGSKSCSKCGWPVCSLECEKNPIHGEQECKIFAEAQLLCSAVCDKPSQYLCVALARLLASGCDADPNSNVKTNSSGNGKWGQFMEVVRMRQGPLNSQQEPSSCFRTELISKSLGSIIHQRLPSTSDTDTDTDQIVRALRACSFITDTEGNCVNGWESECMNNNCDLREATGTAASKRHCSSTSKSLCLYHLGSMLTSSCLPNCVWLIQTSSLAFNLRASQPIKMGERLTISYADPLLPTLSRKRVLWQEKFIYCSCCRCSDPTESCTFFSAIKCPGGEEHCEGYLLPTDPLAVAYPSCPGTDDDCKNELKGELYEDGMGIASWKCNVCLMRQQPNWIRRRIEEMTTFLQDVIPNLTTQDGLRELEIRLDKIDSFVGSFAHANYFGVVQVELEILTRMSTLLEGGKVAFEQTERWALKMIELCKRLLKVVNILCPGLSRERGKLLYFLQQALVINLLFKTSRGMRYSKESLSTEELTKKLHEVLLARKEIHEIFAVTRGENSEEARMLARVNSDSIEIKLLKKHFKLHQNNCNIANNNYKYDSACSTLL